MKFKMRATLLRAWAGNGTPMILLGLWCVLRISSMFTAPTLKLGLVLLLPHPLSPPASVPHLVVLLVRHPLLCYRVLRLVQNRGLYLLLLAHLRRRRELLNGGV